MTFISCCKPAGESWSGLLALMLPMLLLLPCCAPPAARLTSPCASEPRTAHGCWRSCHRMSASCVASALHSMRETPVNMRLPLREKSSTSQHGTCQPNTCSAGPHDVSAHSCTLAEAREHINDPSVCNNSYMSPLKDTAKIAIDGYTPTMTRTVSQLRNASRLASNASPNTCASSTACALLTSAARASPKKHRSANQRSPSGAHLGRSQRRSLLPTSPLLIGDWLQQWLVHWS